MKIYLAILLIIKLIKNKKAVKKERKIYLRENSKIRLKFFGGLLKILFFIEKSAN